jgi:CBS domain-containing membrane protein
MHTVAEIMTTRIIHTTLDSSLLSGRELMGQKGIRHLPVVDDQGCFVGMLDQKTILARAFALVDKYGRLNLAHHEEKTLVSEVMSTEVMTVNPDTSLADAGLHFLDDKQRCLVVTEDKKLVGMITSTDFVRLCLSLLRD